MTSLAEPTTIDRLRAEHEGPGGRSRRPATTARARFHGDIDARPAAIVRPPTPPTSPASSGSRATPTPTRGPRRRPAWRATGCRRRDRDRPARDARLAIDAGGPHGLGGDRSDRRRVHDGRRRARPRDGSATPARSASAASRWAAAVGFLVRKHGLTIDSLLAAEVVTADGRIRLVDASTHPDLFWAIRGGGGNFGVATRFKFRLHEVDEIVGRDARSSRRPRTSWPASSPRPRRRPTSSRRSRTSCPRRRCRSCRRRFTASSS